MTPSLPAIIAPSGEPQPSASGQLIVTVDANALGGQKYLKLVCESQGGRPAPTFEWFHNGASLKTELQPVKDAFADDAEATETQTSTEKQRHFAELNLDRTKIRTGDRLVCLVSNKATRRSKNLYGQKLRAEVLVLIHCKLMNAAFKNFTINPTFFVYVWYD